MSRRLRIATESVDPAYLPIIRLWTLRLLLRCNAAREFVGDDYFDSVEVACMLGYAGSQPDSYTRRWALASLKRKLQALENQGARLPSDDAVARNIDQLGDRLGLTVVERDILRFTVVQRMVPVLSDALDLAGQLNQASVCRVYAECLGHPLAAVRAALDDRATMPRAALLSIDRGHSLPFGRKIDLLEGFADQLTLEHDDLLSLFDASIVESAAPKLALQDFAHIQQDVAILRCYLASACREKQPGLNVLIYGRPGTGKSELVRTLAAEVGAQLLEIPSAEASGKPRAGKARFESYRFAQTLLAGSERQFLLFDEVEDVFCETAGARYEGGNATGIKGWVNQILESNPVPTFWVTNHLRAIDPAYRRRFDFVLQMEIPPASVRRGLIERQVAGLALPSRWCESAATHADLAPALVERAAKVVKLVCSGSAEMAPELVMTRLMNNTLAALGSHKLPIAANETGLVYQLEVINADCDLSRLRDGLRAVGEGRICLYGPPGTGKTAFGYHLAQALDRPLLVKRASDILSPYLGETERNIATMFAEAHADGAVLLLDEADSLLRDRQGAVRSWEVTQVNEMLTQMEAFNGIFVASTNLMDSLDGAAMRRFDARVQFGYLHATHAVTMFCKLADKLGLVADELARAAVSRLAVLTPGDFAAVGRLCRLDRPTTAIELANRLRQACDGKKELVRRPMGFAA